VTTAAKGATRARTVTAQEVFPAGAGRSAFTILDVRAPVEVARGALPHAINVPILDDQERHRVGVAYKEASQERAVALGYALTAEAMPARVERWRDICSRGPAAFTCWRGGMRSTLAQSLLGNDVVPRVEGGYKALRAHLVAGLEPALERRRAIVITGMTGTGKTELLESFRHSSRLLALDLEGEACHRGSAFGGRGAQPAQQTFENSLAARLLLDASDALLLEDESRRIGSLQVPEPLYDCIATSPLLVLEAPRHERIERIHRQYIREPAERLGPVAAFDELRAATARLRKRLGGELVETLLEVLEQALRNDAWREAAALEAFIGPLLSEYYDPLYLRAMEKVERPVLQRGTREEISSWILGQ
jgi:tRNA 2-selenouridine synthase